MAPTRRARARLGAPARPDATRSSTTTAPLTPAALPRLAARAGGLLRRAARRARSTTPRGRGAARSRPAAGVRRTCASLALARTGGCSRCSPAPPLAQPPASLDAASRSDSFTLRAPRARHATTCACASRPYWALAQRAGCVAQAPRRTGRSVQARARGSVHVAIRFSLARVFGRGPRCLTTAPDASRLGFTSMVARVRVLQARLLPHGWLDVLRQVALFAAAYLAYRLVRGLVEGDADAAFEHARDLISLERDDAPVRRAVVQAWASGSHVLMDFSQLAVRQRADDVTVAALVYLYLRHNSQLLLRAQHVHDRDGRSRSSATPCSRRRRRGSCPSGASSTRSSDFTGVHVSHASASMTALFNPYAAVPSMHVAFALMIGWPLARLARHRIVARAVAALPVPDDVRDRRHRQPLHRRRAARRAHRRRLGLRRALARARAARPRGASRRRRHGSASQRARTAHATRWRPGSTHRRRAAAARRLPRAAAARARAPIGAGAAARARAQPR